MSMYNVRMVCNKYPDITIKSFFSKDYDTYLKSCCSCEYKKVCLDYIKKSDDKITREYHMTISICIIKNNNNNNDTYVINKTIVESTCNQVILFTLCEYILNHYIPLRKITMCRKKIEGAMQLTNNYARLELIHSGFLLNKLRCVTMVTSVI
jgi:hypothetical protein